MLWFPKMREFFKRCNDPTCLIETKRDDDSEQCNDPEGTVRKEKNLPPSLAWIFGQPQAFNRRLYAQFHIHPHCHIKNCSTHLNPKPPQCIPTTNHQRHRELSKLRTNRRSNPNPKIVRWRGCMRGPHFGRRLSSSKMISKHSKSVLNRLWYLMSHTLLANSLN